MIPCTQGIIVPDFCLHVNQVNDSDEVFFLADGHLNRNGVGLEPIFHHLHDTEKVGTEDIHFVDKGHTRNAIVVGLSPDRFGLGLNAALAQNSYGTIEDAQGTFDLNGEVDVAGRVDDVDAMIFPWTVVAAEVMVIPRSCSCSIQSMVAAPSCTSPIL